MRWRSALMSCLACGMFALPARAQVWSDLQARQRVFAEVGPGVRALTRDSAGRYFVLAAPGPAVLVYDATGHRAGQIPASGAQGALVFGDDLDVDSAGQLYVADRGANTIKIFGRDAALALSVPFPAPTSVAVLPGGEFAVAGTNSLRLVTVFDTHGKVVREFGDPAELAERPELNRFLNIGRLGTDADGNLYYAYAYLPEPTVRKYDRYGYAKLEIAVTTLEFQPAAMALRREIQRQERGGAPRFKPVITAVGVDPTSQEIWIALGGVLLHFDREGTRRGTYRTLTPEGARLETIAILVEPNRLLLAADPLGIYEVPRPDKRPP